MRFELINPSDPYTFDALDLLIAAAVVAVLCRGMYAAEQVDGDERVPMMIGSTPDAWFPEAVGETMERALHIAHHPRRDELIAALRSVTIGSVDERRLFDELMAALPDDESRRARAEAWHDERRSSMNDIGRVAWGVRGRASGGSR